MRTSRRAIGAAVAGLILITGPALTSAAGTPAARPALLRPAVAQPVPAGTSGVDLQLTRVTPAAVRPTDELTVSGTIRNLGSTTVKKTRISLWLRPQVLPDRASINQWLKEGTLGAADVRVSVRSIAALAPGATAGFTLKVAPGSTGLYGGSGFGPRAIAIDARSGGRRLNALRSTIVWAPNEITTRTRLSVVAPITSSSTTTHAGEATEAAATALMPNGRLQRVLAASRDPAITWAIDPSILTTADRLVADGVDRKPDDAGVADGGDPDAETPSATPSSTAPGSAGALTDQVAKTGAQDWLTQFKSGLSNRDVFALPYGDLDLTSVLRSSKGRPLLRTADELGRKATQKALGAPLDTTIAWPADGQISRATTRTLLKTRRTAVILDAGTQKPTPALTYTPTGHSTVRSGSDSLTGLLYDEQLSKLLGSDTAQTPAATQTMLAQLAAITMEQPDTARHVLAVTPRTWDPNPAAVQTMMNALGSAGWINLQGLSELRDASGPPRGVPVYRRSAAARELPIGIISGAIVLDRGLKNFAPIFADPNIVQPYRERVMSLLSVAWRQNRDDLVPARQDVSKNVDSLTGGVQLVTNSAIFTARKSPIPVTVVNTTPYPVTVLVRLRPQTGQLAFDKPIPVTVAANTRTPVLPLARAVASGNVVVEAKLLTVDGVALGPGKTFTVKVRPEWEGWGLIVIGSILGLMLILGLLRGIRRNRTRVRIPIEAVPDVDEIATQKAGLEPHPSGSSNGGAASSRNEPVSVGATPMRTSMARPVNAPVASVVPPPQLAPLPGATSFRRPPAPSPLPDDSGDPVTGAMSLPSSMPGPEPDPKAAGGTVTTTGFRPPPPPRAGAATPPG